jgi:golgin subfamily B member 1
VEGGERVLEQVNTGEGKSFIIAAMAVILTKAKSTNTRYVDVITSSPVLAQRDSAEMRPIYEELGVTVAHNCSEDMDERKRAYTSNIVYGDIARFERDHLLHTFYKRPLKGDRTQTAVIVDEVDNMLLDNANNMLYLSHSVPGIDLLDSLLVYIQQQVHAPIYTGNSDNNDRQHDVVESMQEKIAVETIKKNVLCDLFGRFGRDDLHRVVNSTLDEANVDALYNKLVQSKLIDADGYLNIHSTDELDKIVDKALLDGEKAQKPFDGFVMQIKTCLSIVLTRERFIELPV